MLNVVFQSIGGSNGIESKLSTHRSDYEIHTPEHRSIPKRPQSTAELVSVIHITFEISNLNIAKQYSTRRKYISFHIFCCSIFFKEKHLRKCL